MRRPSERLKSREQKGSLSSLDHIQTTCCRDQTKKADLSLLKSAERGLADADSVQCSPLLIKGQLAVAVR